MSRRVRSTSLFVVLATAMALTGLVAPGASAEEVGVHVVIVNQPTDAGIDDLITSQAFDPTGGDEGFVQVEVTETVFIPDIEGPGHYETGPVVGAEVTFYLPEGSPSNDLSVDSRWTTSDGIATFRPEEGSENPLSIGTANPPFSTSYTLIPVATPPGEGATPVEGDASDGFNIWEDGCHGAGCNVNIRNANESYTAGDTDVGLGASVVPGSGGISCPDQRVIFANSIFFHATTGDGTDTVFLFEHITRADMKAATNNGQRHVGWCIGLETAQPWIHNGAAYATQVVGTKTLYVAMAPKCPNKRRAAEFAPCLVSQMGDNLGGSFLRGYVLGGDPPRRT
jgi:hypothetical protein